MILVTSRSKDGLISCPVILKILRRRAPQNDTRIHLATTKAGPPMGDRRTSLNCFCFDLIRFFKMDFLVHFQGQVNNFPSFALNTSLFDMARFVK